MKSDTIAIIVVCSSVGLVLVLVAFRYLIRQSNRKNSAPLPPVQPLAHHREIHVAQFQERLSLSPYSLGSSSLRTSRVSLVSKDRSTPTRVPSYILQSETAEDISLNGLPLSPASPLPLPNPSFHLNSAQSDSSLSLGSSTSDEIQQAETPPTSSSFSTQSHATSYSGHESRRSLNQPHSANRSRSRPGSYISVASTSRTSRSIRRGLPHDPQSQLQIVLPAPLAAAASPYATLGTGTPSASRLSVHGMPERRLSFVDGWAPKAMRSEGLYERNRSSSESGYFCFFNLSGLNAF
ncbi:hypothetical protein VNI00_001393 [Paramarasmius palmivorus]|uniref:Uncharacterized protein n=1 Tax=Paramarasmius palmivorus TaxID=297713 RepID=A0AAW0E764_9AGAR